MMAAFLSAQLDFILFFYGLAFILLGAVSFAIARGRPSAEPWLWLGLFGFLHGAGEWLDLTALVVGDAPEFGWCRIAVLTASFMALMEFARREAIRLGRKMPSRKIYAVLAILVALGGLGEGFASAGTIARYTIGLVGITATSLIFIRYAVRYPGAVRQWAALTAVGFLLYALAACAIVIPAPFWPASVLNTQWFTDTTGVPIQLVRGLLACWIAFSLWAMWGRLQVTEVASERYTVHLRHQLVWTLIAMTAILGCGWTLTEFLGGIYRQHVQDEAQGDIDLLASRLAGEIAILDGMVKTLAGSSSLLPVLIDGNPAGDAGANAVLALHVAAAGAKLGFIVDRAGVLVASFGPAAAALADASSSPNFRPSLDGAPGYRFSCAGGADECDYYTSFPVRAAHGDIIGAAVLQKSLDAFAADLSRFQRPYFFVDPDGVVMLTNRPGMLHRRMWPRSAEAVDTQAILPIQPTEAMWTSINGERTYVRRSLATHGRWSMVLAVPATEMFASRVLGLVITLMVTLMALIYLIGRERRVHDSVQNDKRMKLHAQAQVLRLKATTDPLTGLYNRLKFNEELANEISRSRRYGSPLSLVFYDVDYFKRVNDTFGHQVGDRILIELSQQVSVLIRNSDLLARWGGEEFVILAVGADADAAFHAAEKLRISLSDVTFETVGTVTCSFGVAQFKETDTAESFIGRADDALYRAKINGRNRVEVAQQSSVAQLTTL